MRISRQDMKKAWRKLNPPRSGGYRPLARRKPVSGRVGRGAK